METAHIIRLLCSCQPENIALADALAKGLEINILELLEKEGFFELGIHKPTNFAHYLLEGDFSNMEITNLSAIKYFPHLTELDCRNNRLTSLDGIQHLTNLQELYCYDNQISNLDALQDVYNLQELSCSKNQISSLEPLKNLSKLQYVYCYKNPIPEAQIQAFQTAHPNCKITF
jgi:Leucine-rich repeat (LRR) protein